MMHILWHREILLKLATDRQMLDFGYLGLAGLAKGGLLDLCCRDTISQQSWGGG